MNKHMKAKYQKLIMSIIGSAILLTGCSSISVPQNVSGSVPEVFEANSYRIQGEENKNKAILTIRNAILDKAEDDNNLYIKIDGRFKHTNPKILTDTPYVALIAVDVVSIGDGAIQIINPQSVSISLQTIHAPIQGLVQSEAESALERLAESINGSVVPGQLGLKINESIVSLFN